MRPLYLALGAMLAQQSFATMSKTVVPVIAPVLAAALFVDPGLVGVFVSIASLASMLSAIGCGGFIQRYGALRVSQGSLLMMAIGLGLAATGSLPVLVVAALFIGAGTAVSTPASSHVLARHSPARYAPLIFSIKQTGVPVGVMLAGLLAPLFVDLGGWRGALLGTALLALALMLLLQPVRSAFDGDRVPGYRLAPGDVMTTLRQVFGDPHVRDLALATFTFVGLQSVFTSFFVTYLTVGLGYGLKEAGWALSTALTAAVGARIFWGWIGSMISPRLVIACLGLGMGLAIAAMGLFTRDWTLVGILVVSTCVTATGLSWHGVLLSEVARMAPDGRVGAMTGGVLAFGSCAQIIYPLVFSGLLHVTGSFSSGFFAAAVPAILVGMFLMRRRPAAVETPPVQRAAE